MDVNEIYTWRVDFASDFDGIFFYEFLSGKYIALLCIHYHFLHSRSPKGYLKFSTFF